MEKDALNLIYRKYQNEIYLYLYSLCHDWALSEDLAQETFLKALMSLPAGHPNVRAWLYMVARNLCLNAIRRKRRCISIEKLAGNFASRDDAVTASLIMNESHMKPYGAINALDARRREILQLQYFSRLSQKEIAAIMHITPENVRILSYRARMELKKYLEECDCEI